MSRNRYRLGKLAPRYRFFLNHYQEYRFTTCPQCERMMKVRKYPFLVHVDPRQLLMVNMSAKYCPVCDLLILHQDKLEQMLFAALYSQRPDLIGNKYLVLGTVERKAWRESQKLEYGEQKVFANSHDFKEIVLIEVEGPGWYPPKK